MGTIFVDNIKDNVGGKEINIGDGSLNVASDGSVGIGTTSPSDNLELTPSADEKGITLKTTSNIRPYINLESNRSSAGNNLAQLNFLWNGTEVARIIGVAGADTTNKDDGHITFATASAGSPDERMRIASDGNVGIGETSPARGLSIHKEGNHLQLTTDASGTSAGNGSDIKVDASSSDFQLLNYESAKISLFTSGLDRLTIDANGHITSTSQPAFLVHPASSQLNLTVGSANAIAFGTEIFDQNGDFASNTFTAPVT